MRLLRPMWKTSSLESCKFLLNPKANTDFI